jgi:hypothetical protein
MGYLIDTDWVKDNIIAHELFYVAGSFAGDTPFTPSTDRTSVIFSN